MSDGNTRPEGLIDTIKDALQELVKLKIVTAIGSVEVGDDGKVSRPVVSADSKVILTEIDLIQGDITTVIDPAYVDDEAYQRLREVDRRRLNDEDQMRLLMLERIKVMSDHIKGIFNAINDRRVGRKWPSDSRKYSGKDWRTNDFTRAEIETSRPPFPVRSDELVLIRKAWEIGVEEIALQTIVQLDGDVVTRVPPRYACGGNETLHALHNQGVSASLAVWKELVAVVKAFLENIVKIISPLR